MYTTIKYETKNNKHITQKPIGITGLDEVIGSVFPKGNPSLIKSLPLPIKILIGTFADTEKVIKGLGIIIK